MKRRFLSAALFISSFSVVWAPSAFGGTVDVQSLADDFATLMHSIGDQIEPSMKSAAVFGMGMGQAELGNFPHLSFSLTAGAVLAPGILGFLSSGSYNLLDPQALFNSIAGSSANTGLLATAKTFFPYPITRASIAFGTVGGIEGLVQFSILPQPLTTALLGLLPSSSSLGSVTLNSLNAGGEIRKVLVPDSGGFPAISLGAEYVYSNFNVGYDLGTQDLSSLGAPITLKGVLSVENTIHSIGLNLMASKKLGILTVYTGLDAWEQLVRYTGGINNFTLTVSGSAYTTPPVATIDTNDFTTMLNAGAELRFGGFVMFAHGQLDLGELIAQNVFLPAATVGVRLQF